MNTLLLHCRPGFEGEVCSEISEHAARLVAEQQAQALSQDAQGARIEALDTTTGQTHDVAARYVVGCDGPHSLVRKTCGSE